ncbi:hypothetical protein D9M69_545160 [compost metagenome]
MTSPKMTSSPAPPISTSLPAGKSSTSLPPTSAAFRSSPLWTISGLPTVPVTVLELPLPGKSYEPVPCALVLSKNFSHCSLTPWPMPMACTATLLAPLSTPPPSISACAAATDWDSSS